MKATTLFRAVLVTATLLGLSSCGGGGGDSAPPPPPPSTGTLSGTAVSSADPSVDLSATASIAGLPPAATTASGSNLRYTIENISASERAVVRVSSPGHMDTVKVVAIRAGAVTFLRAELVPIGATANIDPASAAQVTVLNSTARLDVPAGALVRADNGAAPPASLAAELTPIDPGRDPERMPGDYTTLAGNSATAIESFGALGVQIRDAQGNRYNLASGKTATIRIPVSSRATELSPTIPLYYLDETTGRWVEDGSAALGGSGADMYYEGTVTHFSYWNADRAADTILVNGCVQTSPGTRVANRVVHTEGLDYSGAATAYTNANGEFSVAMRKNSRAVLTVQYGTASAAPIVAGPSTSDITLPQCLVERAALMAAPTIIVQPAGVTVDEFALASFTAVADGSQPLVYQWRRNGVNIPGATGSALAFPATAGDSGALFSVTVSNAQGSTTSRAATLSVNLMNVGPPRIVGQPQNAAVGAGQQATFAVSVIGAQPFTYKWRRDGVSIAGATNASYATGSVSLADNGARFSVVVSNAEGTVVSTEATLTVTTTGAGVDLYKRPIARVIAGTYDGCTTIAGQPVAPIVVTSEGDVTFEGGVIQMSSSTSSVLLPASPSSAGWSFVDPAIGRSVLVSFSSLGARTATVLDASSNPLITCPIATRTDLPVYRPTALAFIDGTTGTVSCAVQRGTVRTTETLSVSISNAQVTLGALTFSLNAARTSSSVLAGQSNIAGTLAPLLGFTDFYADQSRFSIGRTPLDNRITTLSHVTTSGDSYSCTDSRF